MYVVGYFNPIWHDSHAVSTLLMLVGTAVLPSWCGPHSYPGSYACQPWPNLAWPQTQTKPTHCCSLAWTGLPPSLLIYLPSRRFSLQASLPAPSLDLVHVSATALFSTVCPQLCPLHMLVDAITMPSPDSSQLWIPQVLSELSGPAWINLSSPSSLYASMHTGWF